MKRKILACLAVVFAIGASEAFAQSAVSANTVEGNQAKKEYKKDGKKECGRKDCRKQRCKKDRVKDRKGQARAVKGRRRSAFRNNPYAGMNITEAQRARLDTLRARRMANRPQRPAIDSTMTFEEIQLVKDSVRRAGRLEYLREVREIVGPDQYVIFLENIAVDHPSGRPRKADMKRGHARRHSDKAYSRNHRKDNKKSREGRAGRQTPSAVKTSLNTQK